MSDRKRDHIELAFRSATYQSEIDNRFYYEPMLSAHPSDACEPFTFLGKQFKVPIWVSSMTGGTAMAREINTNLARVCKEFGMGMGLGSCRVLLDNEQYFPDFDMRDIIGEEQALFANLGIGQVEQFIREDNLQKIHDLVQQLRADGLIIHVNPMQEWLQPEGDRFRVAPIDTIRQFIEKANYKVIVKEVGQGIGPASLKELLQLPLEAIEFGAFGGTNFAKVELLRSGNSIDHLFGPLSHVGIDANSMVEQINKMLETGETFQCRQLIISGGIKNFLDGYYLMSKSDIPAIYGQASTFLKYASVGYEELFNFVNKQIEGYKMAQSYLHIK